ncbi:SAM-dependent DNA methyltransferase [Stappia taiwanensis]|uniref:SAM-dependent DNA methyltransferase n=1 Tax=Stappia taiwanensis TaxID=992267 RepID=A0A838XTR4_9HYPH|nr:SAM-dependent DNA methyltransferase [Stappia taiwanensis]MBA4613825.1 SAM-dependent DNA methyltransferase [Stappia taiwanensis]GGE79242.1 hypothetical protein GCM10007285_03830 [Stappia taiwanensis]
MTATVRSSLAVMNRRHSPPAGLDFFPTPPWATRALLVHCLPQLVKSMGALRKRGAWDPCCGAGHMSKVLGGFFWSVLESDVHPYGQRMVEDFLITCPGPNPRPQTIVMNPPFNKAATFVKHALSYRPAIVAALVRSNWLEGQTRHADLFLKNPPTAVFQFVERVPMVAGRWAVNAKTATSYAWIVWQRDPAPSIAAAAPLFRWIPPCRRELSRDYDILRFGGCSDLPRNHPIIRALEKAA